VSVQSGKNNTFLRLSAVHFYADECSQVLNISSICHIKLWIRLGAALVWKIAIARKFHSRVTDSNDKSAYFRKSEIFPLNLKACKNEDSYDYEWSSNWWLRLQLQIP